MRHVRQGKNHFYTHLAREAAHVGRRWHAFKLADNGVDYVHTVTLRDPRDYVDQPTHHKGERNGHARPAKS